MRSTTASLRAREAGHCLAGVKSSIVLCSLNPPAGVGGDAFSCTWVATTTGTKAPVGGLYIIRYSIAVDLSRVASRNPSGKGENMQSGIVSRFGSAAAATTIPDCSLINCAPTDTTRRTAATTGAPKQRAI